MTGVPGYPFRPCDYLVRAAHAPLSLMSAGNWKGTFKSGKTRIGGNVRAFFSSSECSFLPHFESPCYFGHESFVPEQARGGHYHRAVPRFECFQVADHVLVISLAVLK